MRHGRSPEDSIRSLETQNRRYKQRVVKLQGELASARKKDDKRAIRVKTDEIDTLTNLILENNDLIAKYRKQ